MDVLTQRKEEELCVKAPEEITLSPEDLMIKHPLQNRWTLWFYDHGRSKIWEENLREILSFDTIEDFWSLFNHIKNASELRQGCDYSLFKAGIRPMWEDSKNIKGGRWLINLDKKQRADELDKYWLEVVLLMIGEGFDSNSDEICGSVINIRNKGDKLAIWTANAVNSSSIVDIGTKIKQQLGIPQNVKIEYQSHTDSAKKSGSVTKHTHIL